MGDQNEGLWRQRTVADLVEQHDRDLYRGNGKPGITTRLQTLESCIEDIKMYNHERDDRVERKTNMLLAAILAVLGALITNIVVHGK